MALDLTNFKFQSHYTGVWSRTGHSDDKFSGTLFIDGQNIWIELCSVINISRLHQLI